MQRIYKCVYWLMFKFGITRDWWFTKKEIRDACIFWESKERIPVRASPPIVESDRNSESFAVIKKVYKNDN